MILPIVAYGSPILKKQAEEIDEHFEGLNELISNMFETMYAAKGVGLAAPQINQSIRLFVVDASPFAEREEGEEEDEKAVGLENFKKVFINPIIHEEMGQKWGFNEGCLSIPGIREEVQRLSKITISYYDESWLLHEDTFDGYAARVIQHEYDHIEGILFTDKISPLRKKLLQKRLINISKGIADVDYKMKFLPSKR